MDDGSPYAWIHCKDEKHLVQVLLVFVDHERNRDSLRAHLLPRANNEREDYRDMRDFGHVPL